MRLSCYSCKKKVDSWTYFTNCVAFSPPSDLNLEGLARIVETVPKLEIISRSEIASRCSCKKESSQGNARPSQCYLHFWRFVLRAQETTHRRTIKFASYDLCLEMCYCASCVVHSVHFGQQPVLRLCFQIEYV